MLIDEVINELQTVVDAAYCKLSTPPYKPLKFIIYIDYEYWSKCMAEIKGGVNSVVYELYEFNTIRGYPVFRVIESHDRTGTHKHSPFEIYQVKS